MTTDDRQMAEAVAANIKTEMRRQEISQRALASRLGWNELRMSRRINPGVVQWTELTAIELIRIAEALGQPVTAFLPPANGTRPTESE